jgi:LysM repeat protein
MVEFVDAAGTIKYHNGTYLGPKASVAKLRAAEKAFRQELQNSGPTSSAPVRYTVRPGDTLSEISQQFGMSLQDLARLNPGMFSAPRDPDLIYPEEVVVVKPRETPRVEAKPYVVQEGDSLASIAEENGWSDGGLLIAKLNNLDDHDSLEVGETLAVPVVEAAPVPSSPVPSSQGHATNVRAAEQGQQIVAEAAAAENPASLFAPAIVALQTYIDEGGDPQQAGMLWGKIQASVENELRVAADGAESPEDVPTLVASKADEIRARLPEGSFARSQLDQIVDDAEAQVLGESQATRNTKQAQHAAQNDYQRLQHAQAGVDALETVSSGTRKGESDSVREGALAVQGEFAQSMADFNAALLQEYNAELIRIQPNAPVASTPGIRVYSPDTLAQASARLKAIYGGELDVMIDAVALQHGFEGKVSRELDRILSGDPALKLTEYERNLAEGNDKLKIKKDPVTLAMILAAGGRIDPDAFPDLNETQRLEAQKKASNDPVAFGLEQIAAKGFDPANPANQAQTAALQAAAANIRLGYTSEQVAGKFESGDDKGAIKILADGLDAAASPQERQAIWQDVGLALFDADWGSANLDCLTSETPNQPLSDPRARTRYLDKVGLWLQELDAPPELANLLLDGVRGKFSDHWYEADDSAGMSPDYGVEFYKGLSNTIEHADQRLFGMPGRNRAQEFAAWLNDPSSEAHSVLLGIAGREGNLLERSITDGIAEPGRNRAEKGQNYGLRLTDALIEQVKRGGATDSYLAEPDRLSAVERGRAAGKGQLDTNNFSEIAQKQYAFFEQAAIDRRVFRPLPERSVDHHHAAQSGRR